MADSNTKRKPTFTINYDGVCKTIAISALKKDTSEYDYYLKIIREHFGVSNGSIEYPVGHVNEGLNVDKFENGKTYFFNVPTQQGKSTGLTLLSSLNNVIIVLFICFCTIYKLFFFFV